MKTWKHWTPEEDERLAAMAGRVPNNEIAAELGRTVCAIVARRHAIGFGAMGGQRLVDERGLTSADVARILGVNNHAVARLLRSKALEGYKTPDGPKGPNRTTLWRIHRSALATFLRDRPEKYDAASITDQQWLAIANAPRRRPSILGERLLTVGEVARRIFLTESGVRHNLRVGELQGVLCRNREAVSWYVLESSVVDYRPPAIAGRRGLDPETAARRARVLAARVALQAVIDDKAPAIVAKKRAA